MERIGNLKRATITGKQFKKVTSLTMEERRAMSMLARLPGKSSHKDIPDCWEEISDLGDAIASYGKGFSPNYQSKLLRKYYKDAMLP